MSSFISKFVNPEKVFLFLALIFGLILVFVIPPFQSPDEPAHLCRAYGISQFQFFPQKINNKVGTILPDAIKNFLVLSSESESGDLFFAEPVKYSFQKTKEMTQIKVDKKRVHFTDYANMARLSPVSYIPQSTGMFFASLFTSSIYWIMICGKLVTLLFYTVLGYYSIKSLPFLKWACTFILLSPMSLSLGASISADAVLISLSVLYISKILQYSFDNRKIDNRRLALLSVLALGLALTKQSFLMTLFILFIPRKQFETSYLKSLFFIIAVPFLVIAAWSAFAVTIVRPLNSSDFSGHMAYILQHPIKFTDLVLKSSPGFWNFLLIEKMIGVLGWLNIYFHEIYYKLFTLMVLLNTAFSLNTIYEKTTVFQKAVMGLGVVINYVFVCVLMFCMWTPKNQYGYIEIQGRYLTPFILPFLVFCILLLKPFNTSKKLAIANILFLLASSVYIVLELLKVFY